MIFSKCNPPPGYYVYLYLRDNGTPYYCGKGKGPRAWAKDHTVSPPIDLDKIVFPAWGLLELWAFALERKFIRWYGRKDLGTGILRNMTDGGDGIPNRVVSPETVAKSLATKRRTGGIYACGTAEARAKATETRLKRYNGKYTIVTPEHTAKRIKARRNNPNPPKERVVINGRRTWNITNVHGESWTTSNLAKFCRDHNLNQNLLIQNKGRVVENNKFKKITNLLSINTMGWMAKIIVSFY